MSSTIHTDGTYRTETHRSEGYRIHDAWRGERSVLIPILLVGAIASIGMAFIERMY
ncbi:MAG: hypothetical protein K2X11_02675 [Acetobacteraceae bacterium]|nr:hypothetical protein [Acetobacteraceae bacterium]